MTKQITVPTASGTYTRSITPRPVTFRCEWCSELVTEQHYPGPTPRYCNNGICYPEAQKSLNRQRVKAYRERKTNKLPPY